MRGSVADPGGPWRQIRAPRASDRVAPLDRGTRQRPRAYPDGATLRGSHGKRLKTSVCEKSDGAGRKSTAAPAKGLAPRIIAR